MCFNVVILYDIIRSYIINLIFFMKNLYFIYNITLVNNVVINYFSSTWLYINKYLFGGRWYFLNMRLESI